MLQLIAELPFTEYYYDEENKILKTFWKTESSEIKNDEEYKEIIHFWLGLVLKYLPDFILVNYLNLQYPVSSDLQDYISQRVSSIVDEIGYTSKKFAYVFPADFVTMVSTQQLNEDVEESIKKKSQAGEFKYFDNEPDALNWILN